MKIRLLTVSCFLITTEAGVRIITDPYWHNYIPDNPPPGSTEHPPIAEEAEVVTISHEHFNDSYVWAIKGIPRLYTGSAPVNIRGVNFSGVVGRHIGNNQCLNTLILMEADGLRILHMGDFGQDRLYREQLAKIGKVDVLMTRWSDMPVLLSQLKPRIVLPMKNARPDAEMKGMKGFTDLSTVTSEFSIEAGALPSDMKVILLKPELGMGDG
jgi:L-ascorbate metabolism protein UlaG (beta-lactamase superfamily)